ncbi:hypothetical protein [Streptomyces diastatochromogenes]|uniref:hypothetical protein n=1 Tax=Streptomyces diastatochromogenes TaxID=42236 RepID=UPI00369F29BE
MPRPAHPENDRGRIRLVLAVPLTLLTLTAAFFCWTALTIRPSGPWDDEAYGGIVLSCVLTLTAAAAVLLLRLLPSVRRFLGWGWVTPALALGVVAAVRWAGVG